MNWLLGLLGILIGGGAVYASTIVDEPSSLIYNGTRAKAGELTEVVWKGNCTATLVARDVVFTAAHCQSSGSRINFRHDGKPYSGVCTNHPRYRGSPHTDDYSLCKFSPKVPEGTHVASFDLDVTPERGEKLLLTGYGRPNLVNLYWGQANVERLGAQDIVTNGPSNLGSGDSGGPLFRWTGDRSDAAHRYIVGVNSRAGGGRSYFNRTSHSNFTSWVDDYERSNGVELCGVSATCDRAPDPDPDPDPDPGPPDLDCQALLEKLTSCMLEAQPMCDQSYRLFGQCLKGDSQ